MTELDDLTKIVLTAGGTLIVGLVVGIITWSVQARREHSKWVREKRFELYSQISDLASTLFVNSRAPGDLDKMLSEYVLMHGLTSRLSFVGPKKVWDVAANMVMKADDLKGVESGPEREAALDAFTAAGEKFAVVAAKTLKFK